MPTARQNPRGQNRNRPPVAESDRTSGKREADRGLWLDGGVLACACPDCGAPMSLRLWLRVADCFRCGASIELTAEQEQQALRLLKSHEQARRAEAHAAGEAISPTMMPAARPRQAPQPTPRPAAKRPPKPHSLHHGSRPQGVPPRRDGRGGRLGSALGRLLHHLPAWLVSLVLHVVALLLLSLWYITSQPEPPAITLSTSLGVADTEGDRLPLEELDEGFEFEAPGGEPFESFLDEPGGDADEMIAPRIVELPTGAPPSFAPLADRLLDEMPLGTMVPAGGMFAGRDVRLRPDLLKRAGGTEETEAAVARGLAFLVRHQSDDGHWSLDRFGSTPDCDGTCIGAGTIHSDVAATAMALLPLLGAGQTHQGGQYREQVRKGLDWLLYVQKKDGSLLDDGNMYAHGQATIALCEAYAMSGDDGLRRPAQLALNFIIKAQHGAGGWRYQPGQAGDTSVVGWQLMALKSGQMASLSVPRKTFTGAGRFLDRVQGDSYGATYSYQPNGRPTPAMSAEALLSRQYLGWPRDHAGLMSGVDGLLKNLPDADRPNIYYWYYATQVMHHFGGKPWETWNARMRRVLVDAQEIRGHAAGSWSPRGNGTEGGFADQAGRIYMTALAICTLEVYYRHMPIYGEAALGGVP